MMNREILSAAISSGSRFDFLFFWGHKASKHGEVTKSCLSQWFPAPFEWNGGRFPTAEHFMMASKAELFGDLETRQAILAAEDPGKAKALGRKVKSFDEEVWIRHRSRLVVEGNLLKFSQNPRLKKFLLATGDAVLVEASPMDAIWGIGLSADSNKAGDPTQWRGLNLLGFALMEVRDRLRKE
jgi:ribA/ribD-fused uncharacterized protein